MGSALGYKPKRTANCIHQSVRTMNPRLFTLGYARWTVEEVTACMDRYEATLIDVRHTPYTSKPGFSRDELTDQFGPRYRHIPGFGNVNYENGPIQLVDPENGISAIRDVERAVILMCGCKSHTECHRRTVAELLSRRLGGTPTHLRAPAERAQPTLFDEEPD